MGIAIELCFPRSVLAGVELLRGAVVCRLVGVMRSTRYDKCRYEIVQKAGFRIFRVFRVFPKVHPKFRVAAPCACTLVCAQQRDNSWRH